MFRGRVERIEHAQLLERTDAVTGAKEMVPPESGDRTVVTFRVSAVWKGPSRNTLQVMSVARGVLCPGYEFKQGREYVVYATEPAEDAARTTEGARVFEVADCPLRVRTDVAEELRLLGKGTVMGAGRD